MIILFPFLQTNVFKETGFFSKKTPFFVFTSRPLKVGVRPSAFVRTSVQNFPNFPMHGEFSDLLSVASPNSVFYAQTTSPTTRTPTNLFFGARKLYFFGESRELPGNFPRSFGKFPEIAGGFSVIFFGIPTFSPEFRHFLRFRRNSSDFFEIRRNPTKSDEIRRNSPNFDEIHRKSTDFDEIRRNPS